MGRVSETKVLERMASGQEKNTCKSVRGGDVWGTEQGGRGGEKHLGVSRALALSLTFILPVKQFQALYSLGGMMVPCKKKD